MNLSCSTVMKHFCNVTVIRFFHQLFHRSISLVLSTTTTTRRSSWTSTGGTTLTCQIIKQPHSNTFQIRLWWFFSIALNRTIQIQLWHELGLCQLKLNRAFDETLLSWCFCLALLDCLLSVSWRHTETGAPALPPPSTVSLCTSSSRLHSSFVCLIDIICLSCFSDNLLCCSRVLSMVDYTLNMIFLPSITRVTLIFRLEYFFFATV